MIYVLFIIVAIVALNLGFVAGLVYADRKPLHKLDERQDWGGEWRS